MLIQAYRRKDAINVLLGATNIQFAVNKAGHVVADVADKQHVDHLLENIPEAFAKYDGDAAPTADQVHAHSDPSIEPAGTPDPSEATRLAARAQVLVSHSNGTTDDALLQAAFTRSGLTKSGWNAQDQTDIDTAIDTEANVGELAVAEGKATKAAKEAPTKWVVTNGTEKMDLAKLDDKQLRAFAKSAGISVQGGLRGDKIRTLILKALKA